MFWQVSSAVNHRKHHAAVQRIREVVAARTDQVGARAHAVGDHATAQLGFLRHQPLLDELGTQQREAFVEGLRPCVARVATDFQTRFALRGALCNLL